MKDKIKEILLNELESIYCYNCKFETIDEKEAEEKYGDYGCEFCYRKNMNWSLSEDTAEQLATSIIHELVHGYAER